MLVLTSSFEFIKMICCLEIFIIKIEPRLRMFFCYSSYVFHLTWMGLYITCHSCGLLSELQSLTCTEMCFWLFNSLTFLIFCFQEFSPGSSGRLTTMGVYVRDLLLGQVSHYDICITYFFITWDVFLILFIIWSFLLVSHCDSWVHSRNTFELPLMNVFVWVCYSTSVNIQVTTIHDAFK